jgi:OOP family OmpA-OmpF porin
MKLMTGCVIAAFAATATTAMAQGRDTDTGYLNSTNSGVVMSGTGLCWRDAEWTAARATEPCDPSRKPYVAAPMQVAAVAPVRKVAQTLVFDADTLFDNDKSSLRPAGKVALNNFVGSIKDVNPEMINVVGHASRPGTEKYNQRLSEERAESVKEFLVNAGIPAYRVRASGVGETQEVTGPFECLNNTSKKAIACQQPDRHVSIELIGARIPR